MVGCFNRKCPGKIKFQKPVPKGKAPRGSCTACGQKYIAAYDCNGKLRIIRID